MLVYFCTIVPDGYGVPGACKRGDPRQLSILVTLSDLILSETAMSIILIGMPGAGKSTLGKMLAERLSLPFYDTDQLLEQQTGRSLQLSLDGMGYLAVRQLEGSVISQYDWPSTPIVVATGGSAVYSEQAMRRLRALGLCVYLSISLETVQVRVKNWQSRGFLAAPGQSLEAIFAERSELYHRFSDVTIECDELNEQQCLLRLLAISHDRRR